MLSKKGATMSNEHNADATPAWADPSIPVGNAPPMSPWLLVLAAAAWAAGIAFLVVMASWRMQSN